MDTDDVLALAAFVALVGLLTVIGLRSRPGGRPGYPLLTAFAVALVLSTLVVAEEAS